MKIGIITRLSDKLFWGGDLTALYDIKRGMEELGHPTKIGAQVEDVLDSDYIFMSNCTSILETAYNFLRLIGKQYGIICFYDDYMQHFPPGTGLFNYVASLIAGKTDQGFDFSLERLIENPQIIYYWADRPARNCFDNYQALLNAHLCLANSQTEARTILRDCPSSNVQVVLWTAGLTHHITTPPSDEFLKFTGLKSKEYIIQVGRFDFRKNQIGTILATKDLDIPLVLAATKTRNKHYEEVCLETALRYRKAPTIIVSQDLRTMQKGNVRIIPMPGGEKLSDSMLHSAYAHAGLHLHPAFYELPGYTYLESTSLGIPTIASSWTSIKDYFTDQITGHYTLDDRMEYVIPYDLQAIKALVEKKFGQTYSPNPEHPIFKRTPRDIAQEILPHIS
jgi:glycosyltransferase involved in cell wall biosynthesis